MSIFCLFEMTYFEWRTYKEIVGMEEGETLGFDPLCGILQKSSVLLLSQATGHQLYDLKKKKSISQNVG